MTYLSSVIPNEVRDLQNKRYVYHASGFTLIEILVVVLIIGILASSAIVSFTGFGEKRQIIIAAEQFNSYLKFTQQQAILENRILGIAINQQGYQTVRFQPPNRWLSYSGQGMTHPQHFPKPLILRIQHHSINPKNPTIVINATGSTNQFNIQFGSIHQATIVSIHSTENGNWQMVRPQYP